jgi:hypothetical protein
MPACIAHVYIFMKLIFSSVSLICRHELKEVFNELELVSHIFSFLPARQKSKVEEGNSERLKYGANDFSVRIRKRAAVKLTLVVNSHIRCLVKLVESRGSFPVLSELGWENMSPRLKFRCRD